MLLIFYVAYHAIIVVKLCKNYNFEFTAYFLSLQRSYLLLFLKPDLNQIYPGHQSSWPGINGMRMKNDINYADIYLSHCSYNG